VIDLLGERWRVLVAEDPVPEEAELAVSPTARYAMAYVLDPADREGLAPAVMDRLAEADGMDVVARRDGDEAIVRSPRGELRFAPGGDLVDPRGGMWSVEGEPATLALSLDGGRVSSEEYPLALGRLWGALDCPGAGDVLATVEPELEFVDWGGAAHIGGGSHGSLHRGDSLGALILCGTGAVPGGGPEQWTLRDVEPLIGDHFALPS
jgi:hypothetical protein